MENRDILEELREIKEKSSENCPTCPYIKVCSKMNGAACDMYEDLNFLIVTGIEPTIEAIPPATDDIIIQTGGGNFFSPISEESNDMVNHPKHYTMGKYECIDVLEDVTKDLKGAEAICTANAIKYLWRWKQKNGIEDLKKAKWYIQHLIDKGAE